MNIDDPNTQETVPSEIEDLYRNHLITSEEIDPMMTFRDELMQIAQPPREGFQLELSKRLQAEFPQKARSLRKIRALKHLSMHTAFIVLAVLIMGVGVVLAVNAVLQQFITQDDGLRSIYLSGAGTEMSLSQTVGNYTLDLEWTYGDQNRLALGFTVSGFNCSPEQYTFCEIGVRLVDQNQVEVPVISSQGEDGQAVRSYVYNFDTSTLGLQSELIVLQLEIIPYGITETDSITDNPNIKQTTTTSLGEPLILHFTVPLSSDIRVLNDAYTVTDEEVALTLRRVTVSPTQVRLVVCFIPPTSERNWIATARLITNGSEIIGGGSVQPILGMNEDANEICNEYAYNASLFHYAGGWQLEMAELISSGNAGNDQERISGSWLFDFVVP